MTDSSIKAKIAKLLQMTQERGCTEAEAMVALEKAQRLLQEHNLTEVDVLGHHENKDHQEAEHFYAFAWAKVIARAVGELYDCAYVEHRSPLRNKFKAVFKGRQSNAETAALITDFVIKTVQRLSRQAQREHDEENRFATDFCHGCADRVRVKAWELWREANKELIEAKVRARQAKEAERRRLKPDLKRLKPGAYRVWLLNRECYVKQDLTLDHVHAQQLVQNVLATKPRGIYDLIIQCVEGELASEHEYWFEVQPKPERVAGPGRVRLQRYDAFELGQAAGEDIGLRVQVGGYAQPAVAHG